MVENTAFSSSGEEVISRRIQLQQDGPIDISYEELLAHYDIDRTVQEVVQGDFKSIALQFPDELLHHSVPIFRALSSKFGAGRDLYVLADTSYGSCCVDEVAAQHVNADVVIHYGHACMSLTSRLPVIYIFGKKPLDVEDCVARLLDSMHSSHIETKNIFLKLDVSYLHIRSDLLRKFRDILSSRISIQCAELPDKTFPMKPESSVQSSSTSQTLAQPQADCDTIFFVGGESLTLTNLLMTNSSCEVHSYDPTMKTAQIESTRTNKLLMRRYAVVQKARDADVFGILVGTLGVASYLPLISRLRSILSRAHKKSYTMSVGKLNPAKLANFLEIECFVLVACPENSVVEAKEFLRPIVTPYELEIALQTEPHWTGHYELDFNLLLASSLPNENGNEEPAEEEDLEQPVFSLVTGKYRHAKRYNAQNSNGKHEEPSSAVALRNQDNALSVLPDSAANVFLQSRTFRGLEVRVGQDAPSILEQGRSGIAREYADDHK